MSILFSANLSSLRREKGVSQKQAAEALGISQALLSHYEKGIRECHLDFVQKAADYYGVTSDYLLGITESRQQTNELFSPEELSDDQHMIPKTLLRCHVSLADHAQSAGESEEMFFTDFFTLCIKKYLCTVKSKNDMLNSLCDVSLNRLCRNAPDISGQEEEMPRFAKTVSDHAMLLLNKDITDAFK